jgi:RND family efflux transporter MFP subunit
MKIPGQIVFVAIHIFSSVLIQSCTQGKGEAVKIPKATDPVPVKVIAVQKSAALSIFTASGKLTRDDETTLGFKVAGIVKKVYVNEGDQVKKGQVLAALDETEIDAVVGQARQSFMKAQRDLERMQNLFQDSVAALEQLQNSRTAFEVSSDQLTSAVFNKGHALVRALNDGFILKKFVNAGQVVGIGDPAFMLNGASRENWILKVGISDKQWAVLLGGEKAAITFDAFPGKTFAAHVERKSKTPDPSTGLFTVDLKLAPTAERIASGMFGKVSITTHEKTESWIVPYEAVLDATGDDAFVFVTTDGKKARKRAVKIQSFEQDHIALAEGLQETDQLIVSGSAYLSNNDPIEIMNKK